MSNSVKFLDGCSVISGIRRYVRIKSVIYAFTAGAPGKIIIAEVLTKHGFAQNAVYIRVDGDLLSLEGFTALKDLRSALPSYFLAGNRGVIINARRIGSAFPDRSGAVGFWLRDHAGQRRKELIRLGDEGKRAIEDLIIRPKRRRATAPANPPKLPPSEVVQR